MSPLLSEYPSANLRSTVQIGCNNPPTTTLPHFPNSRGYDARLSQEQFTFTIVSLRVALRLRGKSTFTKERASMTPLVLATGFVCSAIASLFVNKYVLSVLRFTFPTIFQGWQCLVSLIVLVVIIKRRNSGSKLRRCLDVQYLPETIFFVCSIYAGSKALSKIPIPTYLGLQNLSLVAVTFLKMFLLEERPKNNTIFSQMVLLTSCVFIWINEQSIVNPLTYFWVTIHVVSSGFCSVFEHVHQGDQLDHEVLLVANNLFAFLSLAPCTFLFGDLQALRSYSNLYFSKFYIGVIFSGVFSAFTGALHLQLVNQVKKNTLSSLSGANALSGYIALFKIIAMLLSQVVFEATGTATTIWCLVSCLIVPALQAGDISHDIVTPELSNQLITNKPASLSHIV